MPQFKKLIEVLKKAKGSRSLNKFAGQSGIDAGHLSRILRGLMASPPVPETLKKISENAWNDVNYEDLMRAAGYLRDRFIGSNLAILRGGRTYEHYSSDLMEKVKLNLGPSLIERYENEMEEPDTVIIEYIAKAEKIKPEFFYIVNNEDSLEKIRIAFSDDPIINTHIDTELDLWLKDPVSSPYLDFIYKVYKSGIPGKVLENAEITINHKKEIKKP